MTENILQSVTFAFDKFLFPYHNTKVIILFGTAKYIQLIRVNFLTLKNLGLTRAHARDSNIPCRRIAETSYH